MLIHRNCFSNKERFPNLFHLATHYLSAPCNSFDAECSVSHSTNIAVTAPQQQSFSDDNVHGSQSSGNIQR